MKDLLATLRLKDVTATQAKEYIGLCEAHLIVLDDVMALAVNKEDGNRFFVYTSTMSLKQPHPL